MDEPLGRTPQQLQPRGSAVPLLDLVAAGRTAPAQPLPRRPCECVEGAAAVCRLAPLPRRRPFLARVEHSLGMWVELIAAKRKWLKAQLDAHQRQSVDAERARMQGKPCHGCGGRLEVYTDGCETCRSRRNGRAKRAREGRRALA